MNDGREDKLPWVKWFWSDWKGEDGLRLVSLSAKGLWIEMLSIMASSKKRGYLLLIDKQMPSKDLAKLVGISEDETLGLLAELRNRGVFSETTDGVIYNRRMVREAEISAIRSECGKMKGYSKSKREAKVKQNRSKGSAPCMSKTEGPSASASASAYASASNNTKNSSSLDTLEILGKWNFFAELHGLAEITEIEKGSSREIHLRKLSKKKGFDFDFLLEIMGRSPFLLGEVEPKIGGKRFFATFDWVINKTNYQKIIEGNYIDREAEEVKKLRKEREDWVNEEEGGKNGKDDKENF